jgi:hypothetical protein
MLRHTCFAAMLTIASVSLSAQAPTGWTVRVDRSANASDPDGTPNLKFVTMGKGFHVTGGPAGTFWNPANTATGTYTAKATFALMKPSSHTNFYGLTIGGEDLGGPKQNYIYFLISQDGTFIVKHRSGDAVHDVKATTANAAITKPDASGKSTNSLEVRVGATEISYLVNGTVVHTTPKTGMTAKTDGQVGIRVNHQLDVHIEGFEVQKSA